MKILGIDTSGQQATAAIVDSYITIGEIMLNARTGEKSWTHSEILMPGIESMFNLTGLSIDSMDYIAYTNGPGSFTGLRIGASTALGLAHGLNKPVIAVPTLEALAYNISDRVEQIVPMMDARRSQVYFAVYQSDKKSAKKIVEDDALPISDVIEKLDKTKPTIFIGDGADENRTAILELFPGAMFAPQNMNRVRGASVALWAMHHINTARAAADNVEISYIRAPQAVREKA